MAYWKVCFNLWPEIILELFFLTDNFTSLENVYSKHGRKIVRSVSRHGSGENSNCSILHEESKGLGPPSLLEGLEHSP